MLDDSFVDVDAERVPAAHEHLEQLGQRGDSVFHVLLEPRGNGAAPAGHVFSVGRVAPLRESAGRPADDHAAACDPDQLAEGVRTLTTVQMLERVDADDVLERSGRKRQMQNGGANRLEVSIHRSAEDAVDADDAPLQVPRDPFRSTPDFKDTRLGKWLGYVSAQTCECRPPARQQWIERSLCDTLRDCGAKLVVDQSEPSSR